MILDSTLAVNNVVSREGKWELYFIENCLNIDMVNHIMAIPPSIPEDGADKLGWGPIETINFLLAMRIIFLMLLLL